jgi:hypothetical protein
MFTFYDQQKFNISYLVFCEIVEFKSTIKEGQTRLLTGINLTKFPIFPAILVGFESMAIILLPVNRVKLK